LVVPALEGDFDQSNYRANVEAVDNSDEEIEKNVISPYDEDINFTNLVDINDVSAGFAVYNARENYMRDLINTVIKADVNRDKMVDIDDVNLIKKAAHIK
jgi:hypothetical protein